MARDTARSAGGIIAVKLRVALLGLGVALAFPLGQAGAQNMPIGGVDLSGWYNMGMAASRNRTSDVVSMVESGQSADTADDTGQSPLGYAASFGNLDMAQALIKYGAPVDRRDRLGNSPLHWAAQRGAVNIVRLLIAAKATIDAQNTQGITPLMLAVSQGQVQVVRLLLQNGADPAKQDYTGRDATGWAAGKPNILQALRAGKSG